MRSSKNLNYLKNLVLPALIFSFVTGSLTGIYVILYRLAASRTIDLSKLIYSYMRANPLIIPAAGALLALIAAASAYIYKKIPNIKGGGIPTSIGILRGLISFKWLRNLVGVTAASLCTFLVGVPLGNEGPSVQIGTAIGRGTVNTFAKKNKAWDRYVMTGGACAGFTAATCAPISGIMFAIEEAHCRISPMIIMVAFTSVAFAQIVLTVLSLLIGVNPELFPGIKSQVIALKTNELWLALMIGIVIGLSAVLFLKYYKALTSLFKKRLSFLPMTFKILAVMLLTFGFGLMSYSFISTGHELVEKLMEGGIVWYVLIAILIFRATMMLSANTIGITGGMFLPIIALSAIVTSMLAKLIIYSGLIGTQYYPVMIALGIAACISGMMKCPLTAVVFSVEALGCTENILAVIIAVAISYFVTEMFDAKSINETVISARVKEINNGKDPVVIDTFVTVKARTFAIGKQIRDIFWPCNLFVLSIKHSDQNAVVDEHGDKTIREGDVLHVRYSCYDEDEAAKQLVAIVGEQDIATNRVKQV